MSGFNIILCTRTYPEDEPGELEIFRGLIFFFTGKLLFSIQPNECYYLYY